MVRKKEPNELYKSVLRAYAIAFLSTSAPSTLGLIQRSFKGKTAPSKVLLQFLSILRRATRLDGFPTLAATLIFSSNIVPKLLSAKFACLSESTVRFLSVFATANVIFQFLNKDQRPEPLRQTQASVTYAENVTDSREGEEQKVVVSTRGGSTLFVTSFAVVNACLASLSILFKGRKPENRALRLTFSTESMFAVSTGFIMWTWVYWPHRLPKSYIAWINTLANFDDRLLEAMRMAYDGRLKYGEETGYECRLPSMAREHGLPEAWGDPRRTIPIPCELFHQGTGRSCTWNFIHRFFFTWQLAIRMHLLLNLVVVLRKKVSTQSVCTALISAARSSAFLSMLASLLMSTVCVVRNLGPYIVGRDKESLLFLESGCAVGCASAACGWSILIEKPSQRKEMALFVAPRALRGLLPQSYDRQFSWREQLAFALSASTILTAAHAKPDSVQGLFGNILRRINA